MKRKHKCPFSKEVKWCIGPSHERCKKCKYFIETKQKSLMEVIKNDS